MTEKRRMADQFLHGYDGGHRLLRGSAQLPSSARELMLVLSDISGPSIAEGFDTYLTGYPIEAVGAYAVARTWRALEMPRPGCVWTHTIVLPVQDWQHVRTEDLRSIFVRPSGSMDQAQYARKVQIPHRESAPDSRLQPVFPAVTQIVEAVYGKPDSPVIVPIRRPDDLDSLILDMWLQQPSPVQQRFAFCSGALTPRQVGGRPFDLQGVPQSAAYQIERRESVWSVVHMYDNQPIEASSTWVLELVRDLRNVGDPAVSLRRFLKEYAWASPNPRAIIKPLVEVHSHLQDLDASPSQWVEFVGERFPTPDEGRRLKVSFFGGDARPREEYHLLAAGDRLEGPILEALSGTQWHAAFDPGDLRVFERGRSLWSRDRSSAERILSRLTERDPTPFGDALVEGVASIVEPGELQQTFLRSPTVFSILARARPTISLDPDLWRSSAAVQRALLHAIASLPPARQPELGGLAGAMLRGGATVAEDAIDLFGGAFATSALDRISETGLDGVTDVWRRALAQASGAVLEWLGSHSPRRWPGLAVAASILPPVSADEVIPLDTWLPLVYALESEQHEPFERERAFLLAAALMSGGPVTPSFIAHVFAGVYALARKGGLSFNSWQLLDQLVPSLGIFRDWDQCERLVRAVTDRFVSQRWESALFFQAFRDPLAFESAIDYCSKSRVGRGFLEALKRDTQAAGVRIENQEIRRLVRLL